MTNFYSAQFVTFLGIALLCYYTIFRKKQWIVLLIASGIFYYWTGIENFVYIFITGFSTWAGGGYLSKYSEKLRAVKKDKNLDKEEKDKLKSELIRKRRVIMWCAVLLNFGMLALIKGSQALGFILPLGISFYMFQSIGYLLDIYNDKYEPETNFARYLLFVSYFPQMIQGPINRYDAISFQFQEVHKWSGEQAVKALYRIGYGLLKKYAIANVYVGIIANIFDTPVRDYSGAAVLFGILLYSAQQYADFSGGIDMVLGVSELFGIRMAENFKQPYFSISLGDFWRRWHISLGKWMRDYVFYPFALTKPIKKLGKWANKKLNKHLGRVLPPAIGNVLVFFIVGIWHGTEWHYVLWGLYNGIIIAISDILSPVYEKITDKFGINRGSGRYRVFQIIRTFIIVNIGWYFDRITDVRVALYSLKKTVFQFHPELFGAESKILLDGYPTYILVISLLACVIVFIVSVLQEKKYEVRELLYRCPVVLRWSIYWIIMGLILFANTNTKGIGGFMYANF